MTCKRPQVVCLCGSTRFMDAFNEVGWQKSLDGEIVLSVGVSKYLPDHHGAEWCSEEVADAMDELHKRKIDLADYVYVLNVDGYIGDSTRSEIEYAERLGKRVDYLEPRQDTTPATSEGAKGGRSAGQRAMDPSPGASMGSLARRDPSRLSG